MFFALIASTLVGWYWISHDWSCGLVASIPLGLIALRICQELLDDPPATRRLWVRNVQVGIAIAIGLSLSYLLRITPEWAIKTAFGTANAGTIRDFRVWRSYDGGGGDHTLIIECKMQKHDLDRLLSARPFVTDNERIRLWKSSGAQWANVLEELGYHIAGFSRGRWEQITPMHQPDVWMWDNTHELARTVVFWESATGRVVVLSMRG